MGDIELPVLYLPDAITLPDFQFELPKGEVPSYTPLVVPPSDLQAPEGVESETKDEEPEATGIRQIDIPIIDIKMPLPENEILATAGTTAVVSVAATLTATAAFKWAVTAMKPILKTTWKKLSQKKKDSLPS
tara:strand:- start:1150 stop:1545 length:396 start_codon:yes stop_codon:yes gene_type:complete